ncbi:MAG: sulfotransferase domain-containing protein [Anaerolineales bacterium]|nr:sulfotransferase domain-containing protein [Anaerolineales bacterium]
MAETYWLAENYITDWRQFSVAVRSQGCQLLKRLDDFPNSVLVAGCQRSGTTMLSRIITQSHGMTNYWFGPDDELDAALILSGYVRHIPQGRYCFQTTYLDGCYREYFERHAGHKLIWVLRNPYSVIYSLIYNWKKGAVAQLFAECGVELVRGRDALLHKLFGHRGISPVRQACYFYVAKTLQAFELAERLGRERLMILDYDDLVTRKESLLPKIYDFIGVEFRLDYLRKISSDSLKKARQLPQKDNAIVREICDVAYRQASSLKTLM